jgi:lipopolysaccharide assembly protein A
MPTLFIAFLFAILIAVFALQNTVAVSVHFLVWDYDTSLVLIILGSAMLGAMLTFLASLGPRFKRARHTRQLEETVRSQGERIRELEGSVRESQETSPSASMKS